jgi:hypothetical protein
MLQKLLAVKGVQELKRNEQVSINGGYDVEKCIACGGAPRPLGCLGGPEVHFCMTES